MLSLAIEPYLDAIKSAFATYLPENVQVGSRVLTPVEFVTDAPGDERFKRDVARFREGNKLGTNWCLIQWNRGPLMIEPDDEFRELIERDVSESAGTYEVKAFGFGSCECNFHLVANNAATIEACEGLYYFSLYKISSVTFTYQLIEFKSRIIHEILGSFGAYNVKDVGTLFKIDWIARLFVPVLVDSSTGKIVITSSSKIYGHDADDTEFEEDGELWETVESG